MASRKRTEPKRAKARPSAAAAKIAPKAVASKARPRAGTQVERDTNSRAVFAKLKAHHADAHCELTHRSPFELIVATVLSAQSTDVMVNQVTPELFRRWPTPEKLAAAKTDEVERAIGRLGFFRQKTKSIVGLSQRLVDEHGGEVPRTLDELVKLPGVGRKTANVVLGVAFGTPEGVVVAVGPAYPWLSITAIPVSAITPVRLRAFPDTATLLTGTPALQATLVVTMGTAVDLARVT